jgi:hypothetical protein
LTSRSTAFSSPFRVKLANVGLMIPPCGVPLSPASVCSPLCMYPAFNQDAKIGFRVISSGILFNSHSCDILSKKPLMSASNTYLS